jgi:hypothetical protein
VGRGGESAYRTAGIGAGDQLTGAGRGHTAGVKERAFEKREGHGELGTWSQPDSLV